MKKIKRCATWVVVLGIVAVSLARATVSERLKDFDRERGDVPGWAIASGAACVLAAVVYTAYSAVIKKWIAKIH